MLRKKQKRVKEVKRIQKRRKKAFYQKTLLTAFLSIIAIVLSFFLTGNYSLISPLPAIVNLSRGDVAKGIERELAKYQMKALKVDERAGSVYVTLDKNQEIVLLSTQDFATELASLQLIMRQLTMEGKRFERVDLRFDKPVIVYAK